MRIMIGRTGRNLGKLVRMPVMMTMILRMNIRMRQRMIIGLNMGRRMLKTEQ